MRPPLVEDGWMDVGLLQIREDAPGDVRYRLVCLGCLLECDPCDSTPRGLLDKLADVGCGGSAVREMAMLATYREVVRR